MGICLFHNYVSHFLHISWISWIAAAAFMQFNVLHSYYYYYGQCGATIPYAKQWGGVRCTRVRRAGGCHLWRFIWTKIWTFNGALCVSFPLKAQASPEHCSHANYAQSVRIRDGVTIHLKFCTFCPWQIVESWRTHTHTAPVLVWYCVMISSKFESLYCGILWICSPNCMSHKS